MLQHQQQHTSAYRQVPIFYRAATGNMYTIRKIQRKINSQNIIEMLQHQCLHLQQHQTCSNVRNLYILKKKY